MKMKVCTQGTVQLKSAFNKYTHTPTLPVSLNFKLNKLQVNF